MTELHEPHGWLFDTRLKELERQKQLRQQQQQQEENQQPTLKDTLDHLQQEHSIIDKIAGAITDNELSSQSKNTYTSDQLARIIKQKYFPPASNDHVNSILQHLAEDHTKVAAQTKHISPPEQTMLYQSRAYHNHIYGLENKNKQRFCSRPF
jgi:hypothetical protein